MNGIPKLMFLKLKLEEVIVYWKHLLWHRLHDNPFNIIVMFDPGYYISNWSLGQFSKLYDR